MHIGRHISNDSYCVLCANFSGINSILQIAERGRERGREGREGGRRGREGGRKTSISSQSDYSLHNHDTV